MVSKRQRKFCEEYKTDIGHRFNGNGEKHGREWKPIIKRFHLDDARVTLDGPQLTKEENDLVGRRLPI